MATRFLCCRAVYFLFVIIKNLQSVIYHLDILFSATFHHEILAFSGGLYLCWAFQWFLRTCVCFFLWLLLYLLFSIPFQRMSFCLSISFQYHYGVKDYIYFVYCQVILYFFLCWNYPGFGQGGLQRCGDRSCVCPCFRSCLPFAPCPDLPLLPLWGNGILNQGLGSWYVYWCWKDIVFRPLRGQSWGRRETNLFPWSSLSPFWNIQIKFNITGPFCSSSCFSFTKNLVSL